MTRELWNLRRSGSQLLEAEHLGHLPVASIQADTFLHPSIWNSFLPIRSANELHDRIHPRLARLSTRVKIFGAPGSDHFVWVERPDVMLEAVKHVLEVSQIGPICQD